MKNIFNRKSVFVKSLSVWSAFAVIITTSAPAFAAGTAVLGGDAVLTGATGAALDTGTATDAYAQFVSSGGPSAVLDWSAFNIGAGKEMNFSGAGTTFFNLVDASASKSQIDGIISGNGSVWVINPNGIAFGANSSVNVGGLFAAAAGNISNADELRNGATLPEFSSFGGEVSVADGSVFAPQSGFSPSQVYLMGKKVTASGEFSGIDELTLAAGNAMKLTVDEVAGGKVVVDVEDFGDAANSVVLDGLVFEGGSVDVAAEGKVTASDVSIAADESVSLVGYTGDVVLGGNVAVNSPEGEAYVSVRAAGGDIVIGQDTEIEVNGKFASVDMMAGRCSSCDPSGVSDGSCSEEGIRPGAVKIGADATIAVSGTESAYLQALSHAADVTVGTGGSVEVEGGPLILEIYGSGDVVAETGSTVKSGQGMSLYGENIKLGGDIQSHGWINAHANESLTIGDGATVKTDGDGASVYLDAGLTEWDDNCQLVGVSGGNVTVGEGAIVASDGQYGSVGVSALKGSVDIKGEVRADNAGTVSAMTGMSDSMMGGSVMGGGDVNVHDTGKVVGQSVFVNALGGKVSVSGAVGVGNGDVGRCVVTLSGDNGVTSSGTLDVKSGTLEVYGNRGDINLFDQASGVVYAGDIILVAEGNVYADNPNNQIGKVTKAEAGSGKVLRIELGEFQTVEIGNIVSETAYIRSEKGTIKVVGDITAPEQVVLETEKGDIIVMENCTVTATGSGAVVKLNAGRDVINDGALVSDGAIDLAAGRDIGGAGTVAAANDVAATAGGSVKLSAANGLSLGDVTAKNGDVDVSTVRGDIVVNGVVQSKAESGTVLLKAATDANADGSIIVNEGGGLAAPGSEGSVIAIAGYGKLKAEGKIDGGDVKKLMKAFASAGLLGSGAGSMVDVADRATVVAGRLIVLEGEVGVVSAGLIDARQADLEVYGHNGDVDLNAFNDMAQQTGTVLAKNASFVTDGSIYVDNAGNEIGGLGDVKFGNGADVAINMGGFEKGFGGAVTLYDAANSGFNNEEMGTILIVGDVTKPTAVGFTSYFGDVIVLKDCTVKATGDGAFAFLSAGRNVTINGMVQSDGDIQVEAPYGNVALGDTGRLSAENGWVSFGYDPLSYPAYGVIGGSVDVNGRVDAAGIQIFAAQDVNASQQAVLNGTYELDVIAYGKVKMLGGVKTGVATIQGIGDVEVGNISANQRWDMGGDPENPIWSSVDITSINGKVHVLDGTVVESTREGGGVYMSSYAAVDGGVAVDGTVRARGADGTGTGTVYVESLSGQVLVGGTGAIEAGAKAEVLTHGGDIKVARGGIVSGDQTAYLQAVGGNVVVDGQVKSESAAFLTARDGGIVVGGTVDGTGASWLEAGPGGVRVDGKVLATSRAEGAEGLVVLDAKQTGGVTLGRGAEVRGALGAVVQTQNGDLIQEDAPQVGAVNGRAQAQTLKPAVAADNVIMVVKGNVAGGNGGSVTVDGKVVGVVAGDAKVAIANGKDLVGGTRQDAANVVDAMAGVLDLDVSALGENSAMIVGGNLSLYTAGGIGSYTTFKAGGDASISAARFGDTSYLQAGGTLTINNVGHPSHPQIAYFESVNGKEPKINNQPNDTVIFVDGRLAGGNLNILNKFGADEAFMVETPELKSTQGIFGNPPFLHSDLDVANPMEVSAIDYLLQEVPRLTLSSDFPAEVDQTIEAVGLGQKDSYWFGQKSADEKKSSDEPTENTADAEKDAEKPSDKTVALVR